MHSRPTLNTLDGVGDGAPGPVLGLDEFVLAGGKRRFGMQQVCRGGRDGTFSRPG